VVRAISGTGAWRIAALSSPDVERGTDGIRLLGADWQQFSMGRCGGEAGEIQWFLRVIRKVFQLKG